MRTPPQIIVRTAAIGGRLTDAQMQGLVDRLLVVGTTAKGLRGDTAVLSDGELIWKVR